MKRTLLATAALAMLLALPSCGVAETNPNPRLTIELDTANAHPLNKMVYGVNNELVGPRYKVSDKAFIDAVNDIGIQAFRYPAGTYSNFIDLKSGGTKIWKNNNAKSRERNEAIENSFKRKGFGLDYRDLVKMLDEVQTTVSFIVNISSADFDDNMEAIRDIKKRGMELTHFEFGNELYYSAYAGAIPTPEDFVKITKKYIDAIREVYPDAKFGACLKAIFYSGESFLDEPNENNNRLTQWYFCLKRNQAQFDGFSIHFYSEIGMPGSTKIADFIPFEESYRHTISHADCLFDKTMDRLESDFPGKEFWITEYHVSGFMGEIRNNYHLRRSYLGALYCSDFMLKLFCEPNVKMSNWHAFQGFLRQEGEGDDMKLTLGGANGMMFRFFKEPALECDRVIPVNIAGAAIYKGLGKHKGDFSQTEGAIFYNSQTKEGYLMVFNKLDSIYSISPKQLESAVNGEILSVETITADTTTMPLDEAICDTKGALIRGEVELDGGCYTLQPYSINRYKFKGDIE